MDPGSSLEEEDLCGDPEQRPNKVDTASRAPAPSPHPQERLGRGGASAGVEEPPEIGCPTEQDREGSRASLSGLNHKPAIYWLCKNPARSLGLIATGRCWESGVSKSVHVPSLGRGNSPSPSPFLGSIILFYFWTVNK